MEVRMNGRRYFAELGGSLVLYGVLLIPSIILLQRGVALPWRVPVAVMPMLAAPLMAWSILRQLRRMDELQRRIQLEAISVAFMGAAMLSFTYGFLENAGFARLSMFCVWPVMAVFWLLAMFALRRRYGA